MMDYLEWTDSIVRQEMTLQCVGLVELSAAIVLRANPHLPVFTAQGLQDVIGYSNFLQSLCDYHFVIIVTLVVGLGQLPIDIGIELWQFWKMLSRLN